MMIRALLVSITLLLLVVPTAAWIDSKITDNIEDIRSVVKDYLKDCENEGTNENPRNRKN